MAKAEFQPLLQEALDIRNHDRQTESIFGQSTRVGGKLKEAGGWLERANQAMQKHGLEVIIDAKDGKQGHC